MCLTLVACAWGGAERSSGRAAAGQVAHQRSALLVLCAHAALAELVRACSTVASICRRADRVTLIGFALLLWAMSLFVTFDVRVEDGLRPIA